MRAEAIGHCDSDAFYVSAERVRNQFLVAKPVGVLGNQGACVIAKSYEMKSFGVKTGEPIWEAFAKCPGGLYELKRDFRWYEVLSRKMLAIIRDLSPRVEYHSIDEFFFLAIPPRGTTHEEYARLIRDRIWEAVGVPVTVGIGRTRTLAKLLSDASKPFGARAVLDAEAEAALLDRPVTEIAGIAGRREKRLLPWNIRTCLDLARSDRRLIRALLTANGEALWWELNGEPVCPINSDRPAHKALSRGGSFGEASDKPMVIFAWLVRNLERLIEELHYHEVRTGKLTVWVAYRNGQVGEGHTTLIPSERFDVLLDAARPCLRQAWIPRVAANRMHLIAERLVHRGSAQLGLFDRDSARAEALARVKRQINDRHGRFVVRSGATLPLPAIYQDTANGYDICDVRGKTCF